MSETKAREAMTIEEAVKVLNEQRWHGRDDWRQGTTSVYAPELYTGVHWNRTLTEPLTRTPALHLDHETTIAIAQGLLDAERVVGLDDALATLYDYDCVPMLNSAIQALDIYINQLRDENAELRQSLERAEARHREYQKGLEKIANAIGVTTPLQLVVEADNDEQSYFDLLVKKLEQAEMERDSAGRQRDIAAKMLYQERELEKHNTGRYYDLAEDHRALRTTCRPFVEVARRLADMLPETEWPYPGGVRIREWRALLAAFDRGEKQDE